MKQNKQTKKRTGDGGFNSNFSILHSCWMESLFPFDCLEIGRIVLLWALVEESAGKLQENCNELSVLPLKAS
jgi:hypothetical protein